MKNKNVYFKIFFENPKKKSKNIFRNFDFFRDGMFAACKEKPKKQNMPLQNVISLPSIGRFVDEIAL